MLRVTTQWGGLQGSPYYTILHYLGDTEDQAEAAHAATVAVWTAIGSYRSSTMTCRVAGEVEQVDPATGAIEATYAVTPVDVGGGAPGELQPTVIQGLVQLRTGTYLAGREVRGRVFLPGSRDTSDLNGRPTTAYISGIQTAFNALRTDTTGLGIPLQVWSPTRGVSASVSACTVWGEWAVLRSRRQ